MSIIIKVKSPQRILNKQGKENRNIGKRVLLASMYGMGPATAGVNMKKTPEEAQTILNNFFAKFTQLKKAIDDSQKSAKKLEYVEDFLGRRRRLPEINLPPYTVELKTKAEDATNFNPILGCSDRVVLDQKILKWQNRIQEKINETNAIKQKYAKPGETVEFKNEMSNKAFDMLAKEALADGVIIHANTGRIAQALRQTFNARVQGCLSGDVRVQTKDFGFKKLSDLENMTLQLWDSNDWTTGTVIASGKKKKNIIKFSTDQEIVCSPDHKFLTISTYGTEKFKKCSELKPGDRLLINQNYMSSDKIYSSNNYKLESKAAWNSNRIYVEDIVKDSRFNAGRVLGRIASDGSYALRVDGGSAFSHIIAEHEFSIISLLEEYMKNWNTQTKIYPVRENRNQKICNISKSSYSLVNELEQLDINHQVHENLFEDTDLLRGFISGFFDGDGCATGNGITLTFGKQYDFSNMLKDLQKALLFYGIRSSTKEYSGAYRLTVRRADCKRFSELIGFLNENKQKLAASKQSKKDNHCFNGKSFLIISDIIRTEELIDMYDVCNTDRGYFVADGLITHNSAASLTKLAMVDIYRDKVLNDCQTKLIIPVHDELLVECPAYYADIVEKRLPEVMIAAALRGGNKTPQACDPYNVSRWGSDYLYATILDEYKKLEQQVDRDEAIKTVLEHHSELPEQSIIDIIDNKVNDLIF